MDVKIESSWKKVMENEFEKPYFSRLVDFVRNEYSSHKVFPPGNMIFRAFDLCPFEEVKIIILGQDPYHGDGQAHGLSFSVSDNIAIPPSLRNIYQELHTDIGKPMPKNGNLTNWAKQGVLLLNATLTVRAYNAGSHQKKGWEEFTDAVISKLSENRNNLVFILWGSYARGKSKLINRNKHLLLESVHPSPLSANRGGWFGNKHFSQANKYLEDNNKSPIEWVL